MFNFSKPKHLLLVLLFLLLLPVFSLLILVMTNSLQIETYGSNKTIGWAWDFCSFIPALVIGSLLTGIVVYGFLSLFKTRLNRIVSIIHLVLIIITFLFLLLSSSQEFLCITKILLSVLGIILSLVNVVFSISYKLYDKKKRLDN